MLEWTLQGNKTAEKLQKINVTVEGEKRKISKNEAMQMIGVLNKTAIKLMDLAKEVNGAYEGIKIIKKSPTSIGNCPQSSGVVSLDVTFDKSAKVTDVVIKRSSNCSDFDNNAVKAARKIKFEPAKSDGQPISVTKTVTYSFSKF
jgi:TonB family protein